MLTNLVVQLNFLFKYSEKILDPAFKATKANVRVFENCMVNKLRKKIKVVTIAIIASVVTVIICYIVAVVFSRQYNKNHDLCLSKYVKDAMTEPYEYYIASHLILNTLVTAWLVTITVIALVMLQNKKEDDSERSFASEAKRIKIIYITFIVAFGIWVIYDIVNEVSPLFINSDYKRVMLYILMPMLYDFIPITTVLITHYKNTTSFNRIMKFTLQQHIATSPRLTTGDIIASKNRQSTSRHDIDLDIASTD